MSFLSPRELVRRSVYLPWVPIPEGRMVELPGPRVDLRHRHPGPATRLPHRPAAARAWAAPGCSRGSPSIRPAVRAVPRGHPRPALARSRHPVRRVLALRLRRRRRGPARRARRRPGDPGRLLDGLDHRPAGLAPAPRPGRRGSCCARPPTGSGVEPVGAGCSTPGMELAMVGHPRRLPVAYGGARGAGGRGGAGPRTLRHPRLGDAGVPQHQPLGGRPGGRGPRPAPLAALALEDRRPDRGGGHQRRQGRCRPATSSTWPAGSRGRPSTTSTPDTPAACWRRRPSCRRWSRRSRDRQRARIVPRSRLGRSAQPAFFFLRDRRRLLLRRHGRLQPRQLGGEALHQVVDVRHRLAAGDDPDVHLAVVGHHGDVDARRRGRPGRAGRAPRSGRP